MKTFFLSLAGAFCAIILFIMSFFGFMIIAALSAGGDTDQPDNMVLTLDLRNGYSDQAAASGFTAFSGSTGFIDILTRLKAAETDPNVKGLFIRGAQGSVGSSRAEELRQALNDFRASGKYVIAHTQGSLSTGPSSLRAIAAADEIWVQPGTDLMVSGVTFETLFMKDLLDKLSIISEVIALYEYKNAPNDLKENDFTGPHREAMTRLAESLWIASLEDIAQDREMDVAGLRAILEAGPMSAEEAIDKKIMDKLGWPEEAMEAARDRDTKGNLVSITAYRPPTDIAGALQIAIVGGEGGIVTGSSSGDGPFSTSAGFASDPVAGAILAAGRNEKIKAIVFRVDSPGGSPTASDQIWRSIERVQEDGKPVIVSMASVAASGGYYVSTGADYIMASRSTITGSIGIFGGKSTYSGGLERIGVHPRSITVGGEFTDAFDTDPFTDTQREMLRASLQRGYDRFTSLVAEGRNMSQEEVHTIARGRVWSGEDALAHNLVDGMGGFMDAIEKAKELAGIDADAKVRLVYYPKRKTGFAAIEELFGASAEVARAASVIGALAGDARVNAVLAQMQLSEGERIQATAPILIEN